MMLHASSVGIPTPVFLLTTSGSSKRKPHLQAMAILRGEMPTRKRARQFDAPDQSRSRASPFQPATDPSFFSPGAVPSRPPYAFQDQATSPPDDGNQWPQQGPYIMPQWRLAIQKQVFLPSRACPCCPLNARGFKSVISARRLDVGVALLALFFMLSCAWL